MNLYEKGDFIKLKNGDVYLIEQVKNRLVYMVDIKTDEEEGEIVVTIESTKETKS